MEINLYVHIYMYLPVSHAVTPDIKMKDSGLRRMLSDCSSVSDQRSMEESLTSNSLRLSSFGESSVG